MGPALLLTLALAPAADAYLVMKAAKTTLQRDLETAATSGYRVVDTFDEIIVLRRAHDGRYAYLVADARDAKSLEAMMNTAAADGFRLAARAVMGDRLVAIMEARIGSPPNGARYRVLSFTTKYTITSGFPRTVRNRIDTSEVDKQLAELSTRGYRIVAAGKRDLDKEMKNPSSRFFIIGVGFAELDFRQELILVAEKTDDEPARNHSDRYHVVGAGDETELHAMLNGAAAAGYRFVMGVPNGSPEVIAIFEKEDATDQRPAHAVLATRRIATLQKEIGSAASGGWLPHAHGLFDLSGGPIETDRALVVVERGRSPHRESAIMIAADRVSTFNHQIAAAAAAGFRLLMAGNARREMMAVLTR